MRMQRAIREKFTRHTLMCIAHKLHTIMSFDMMIVLVYEGQSEYVHITI